MLGLYIALSSSLWKYTHDLTQVWNLRVILTYGQDFFCWRRKEQEASNIRIKWLAQNYYLIESTMSISLRWGFPGGASDKKSACQCSRCKRPGFDPWTRKIPWRRAQQLTPVFLPRESHGQRSLVGFSPWVHKDLDTTGRLTLSLSHGYIMVLVFQ